MWRTRQGDVTGPAVSRRDWSRTKTMDEEASRTRFRSRGGDIAADKAVAFREY